MMTKKPSSLNARRQRLKPDALHDIARAASRRMFALAEANDEPPGRLSGGIDALYDEKDDKDENRDTDAQ